MGHNLATDKEWLQHFVLELCIIIRYWICNSFQCCKIMHMSFGTIHMSSGKLISLTNLCPRAVNIHEICPFLLYSCLTTTLWRLLDIVMTGYDVAQHAFTIQRYKLSKDFEGQCCFHVVTYFH